MNGLRLAALGLAFFGSACVPVQARIAGPGVSPAPSRAEAVHDARPSVETAAARTDVPTTAGLVELARAQLRERHWQDAEATVDRIAASCVDANRIVARDAKRTCKSAMNALTASLYLEAGAYRKWAEALLVAEDSATMMRGRPSALSTLAALGRGLAAYGAYPEALCYLQRCVEEARLRYPAGRRQPGALWTAAAGDVEASVVDSAHSFPSQAPRCLEDLAELQRVLGNEPAAEKLEAWEKELWEQGPDIEDELLRRLRLARKAWPDDSLVSAAANDLAYYYAGKSRADEAIRTWREALQSLDAVRRVVGKEPDSADGFLEIDELLGLAKTCENRSCDAEGEAFALRAALAAARDLPPGHAWYLKALERRARAVSRRGLLREAAVAWSELEAAALRDRGEGHPDHGLALAGLADALDAAGRGKEASEARRRASAARTAWLALSAKPCLFPLPSSLRSPPSPAN